MLNLSYREIVVALTLLSVASAFSTRPSVDQRPWPPPSLASRCPVHIGVHLELPWAPVALLGLS
eukprot:5505932-Pyramimonas_sp.AAC.1